MSASLHGYAPEEFTFANILADKAQRNGDKTFLHYLHDGRRLSYREVDLLSNRVANGLIAANIGKGDHVAMLMENSPEQVLAYFALGKIGAVVVPINIAARGQFLEYYLQNSSSVALIVDEGLLPQVLAVEDRSAVGTIIVAAETGSASMPHGDDSARLIDFATLLGHEDTPPGIDVRFNDLCAIMYTSGTTGPSKGNLFPQIQSLTFGLGFAPVYQYGPDDIYYIALPLFHGAAYNAALLPMLVMDAGVAIARRFSVSRFWSDIRESRATIGMMLGMGHFLLGQPPSDSDRDHCLRILTSSPMLPNAAEFEARFGPRLVQGYGLTDFGCAFATPLDMPEAKRFSMGRLFEGYEARLVDDDDREVPVGEPGELLLRRTDPPFAMSQGYYNMPEASLKAMRNLWFHTGDRVMCDEDGYYFFVDRKKDALRRRGENISTYEVELAILSHPAVADAAAYPVQLRVGDDEVGVSIVMQDGMTLSEHDLFLFCRDNMPHYMVPRFIDVRESLPRTLTNKLRKQEMRDHVEANLSVVWDSERAGLSARERKRSAVQVSV